MVQGQGIRQEVQVVKWDSTTLLLRSVVFLEAACKRVQVVSRASTTPKWTLDYIIRLLLLHHHHHPHHHRHSLHCLHYHLHRPCHPNERPCPPCSCQCGGSR
ncbi:unnamed protein product [Closterium sp. NIES-53]